MTDLDNLFEAEAARQATETDAYLARPEVIKRTQERREALEALITREIAEGLRTADGSLVNDYGSEDEDDE